VSFYLGLDGGGTKTEAALVDRTGRVVAETRGGAANPLRSSFAHAFTALDDVAARALAAAGAESADVLAVCAGFAGAGQPRVAQRVAAFLTTRFRQAAIETLTDLDIALESIAADGPAVVLVSGTGSAAFGRDADGRTARAGGWGPWFSDEGSAFDIGRSALAALARAHDDASPSDPLADAITSLLGADRWEKVVERVRRRPLDSLPALFPAVASAADAGSDRARRVLDQAVENLSALVAVVIRRLALAQSDFALGRVGGVFGRSAYLDARIDERLLQLAPRAEPTLARVSPAVAAAHRARRRAG
jgi:N-acetylglucosamine kinase-like BadF-type ATPase